MSIIISHPNTAPFIQASVRGYHQKGLLDKYITTFMDHPDYWLSSAIKRLLPSMERELSRRAVINIPIDKTVNYPYGELIRTLAGKYTNPRITDFIWEIVETGFDRKVATYLHKKHRLVHVYEHAGLATIQRAKALGIISLYEQPSQHHAFFTRIVEQQFRHFPELKTSASILLNDEKAVRRNQRRDKELKLADIIRCNSSFTKRTLVKAGVPEEKISVIPYGFPKVTSEIYKEKKDKVIFLNAGSQNLRKAIHLLYTAWRKCNFSENEAELWLIGKMVLPESLRQGLPGKVIIRDSIPRNELMELYYKADVFVLPTLADGFGMVISEAMSRGVPVITTENSGGPDIITHQKDGFIIPAGDEAALVAQMKWCVQHKHLLPAIGQAAWEKAKRWQWEDFEKAVADFAFEKISTSKSALVGK